ILIFRVANIAKPLSNLDIRQSAKELAIGKLIRPYIAQAYSNAQKYTKLQQQLDQLNQAVDELGSVILSPAGRIRLLSPRALQLLNQYFPGSSWLGEQLPEDLQNWVKAQIQQRHQASLTQAGKPLQVEQEGQYLSIRLLGSASSGQFLLTLEENRYQSFSVESLRRIGLTQREAEVLLWVARGKMDAEIAAALDIKPKTVNKHLENLSKKLTVNTRAEAVTEALKLLGQMEQ
ncbi:MAG: LuxR C-terminal-related transcriptional regulator, partial [Kovacikia sp.]